MARVTLKKENEQEDPCVTRSKELFWNVSSRSKVI